MILPCVFLKEALCNRRTYENARVRVEKKNVNVNATSLNLSSCYVEVLKIKLRDRMIRQIPVYCHGDINKWKI